MKNKHFIQTQDEKTAHTLENLGFRKVSENNFIYVFMNSDKLMFSNDIDKAKIRYTDILCI